MSFGDFVGGGLGGVFGGGPQGVVLGVAARRVLESTPFKLLAAKTTQRSADILAPVFDTLSPIQKGIFTEFIESLNQESVPPQ